MNTVVITTVIVMAIVVNSSIAPVNASYYNAFVRIRSAVDDGSRGELWLL